MMQPLPPHVQAAVDELVADAPPLTPDQVRLIQRFYAAAEAPETAAEAA